MTIVYVVFALFLGSVGSIALAGLMFLLNNEKLEKHSFLKLCRPKTIKKAGKAQI